MWAETPVVAATAEALLLTLGNNGMSWAEEALE
jgi:hypothetical protein